MSEGAAGTFVKLGLTLDTTSFKAQIEAADSLIRQLGTTVNGTGKAQLKVGIDTSLIRKELKEAQKLINATKGTIKVATSFYKGGSNFAVSKTALYRDVLRPLQDSIKDDRKYQIKIGAYIDGDVDVSGVVAAAQKQLDRQTLKVNINASIGNGIEEALSSAASGARNLIAAYEGITVAAKEAAAAARLVAQAQAAPAATRGATRPKADIGAVRQTLIAATETKGKGGLDTDAFKSLQQAASGAGIKAEAAGVAELRKQLRQAFTSAGDDAIKGLALGLAKGEIQIKGAGDQVGKDLIAALKKSLGIASPAKKVAKDIGEPSADGVGTGFIRRMAGWERQMAGAIREAVGSAIRDGVERDRSARAALDRFGKDAGSTIATSLSKALKQGLASSVAPALKGGLLGATGGALTGGLAGGIGAAAGAAKAAVMPSMLTFGYGSMAQKAGMLGQGAASLASGGASEAFNNFIHGSIQQVLDAALSTGGQGALLGAAGVAGVAGLGGLAKGAAGSMLSQAVEAIKNRIISGAVSKASKEAQALQQPAGPLQTQVADARNLAPSTFKVGLTKAQVGLLDHALQLDNTEAGTFAKKWEEIGGKLSTNMELTGEQLTALANEIDTNAVLDDIEVNAQDLGRGAVKVAENLKKKFAALKQEVLAAEAATSQGSLFSAQGVAASITRNIAVDAIGQSQRQGAVPGATAASVAAPVQNAGNVMGLIGKGVSDLGKRIAAFVKGLTPGNLRDRMVQLVWTIDQAAEQFKAAKGQTQILAAKIQEAWQTIASETPERLLPPPNVSGTSLTRQQNLQLGDVVGRTAVDFRSNPMLLMERADEAPYASLNKGKTRGYLEQTRRQLNPVGLGEWNIVKETNGIWKRIKTDAELAAAFQKLITGSLSSTADNLRYKRITAPSPGAFDPVARPNWDPSLKAYTGVGTQQVTGGARTRTYTGTAAPGMFNPFDPAFYRPTRPPQAPPPPGGGGGGGNFIPTGPNSFGPGGGGGGGGNRFGTPSPGTALARQNIPVEFFTSFRDAEKLIATVASRLAALGASFDRLKVKSQVKVNESIFGLNASLRAVELSFQKGEISGKDFVAATYGLNRELAGLGAQTAEVQNLAQAFNELGIESNAALKTINDQRNLSLNYIQDNPNISKSEKTRARNARDIQQATFINDQVRVAQSASGFGGFRGREIGNDQLIKRQQKSELANAIRQLEEYGDQITKTGYNQKTFGDIQEATAKEINNAKMALRVLQDEARDGEKITLAARNAWGTILDDFKNLLPQLLVFAVAYNLILQRVMATPGAVVQAAAAFDRLNTSIDSYLSSTRGIGDTSGELEKVRSVALDLGVGFEKAAKSYLSFAAATQGTTLEGREADISRTLFTAGRNQGLSGEQLDRAATALTQILSKGRVQAEELRGQLAEQLPGAVQVAARAYGVTTRELYRMVEAGQLASDEFVDKFMKQLVAEGADVNQLAGNFSNVTEQLGSSVQMLAASAGDPLLEPLTLGLRALNAVITALVPMGPQLAAFFTAMGLNAAKNALGIASWRKELLGTIGVAAMAESTILGDNGKPLQKPTKAGQVAGGLQTAGSGLAQGLNLVGLAKGNTDLTKMKAGLGDVTKGLKEAATASAGLGTGLKAALMPALKMYLVIEGIGLAIKVLNGEISTLSNEAKKSASIIKSLDSKRGFGEEAKGVLGNALGTLNVPKTIQEFGNNFGMLIDSNTIVGNSKKINETFNKNKAAYQKAAAEILYTDKRMYQEKQRLALVQTDKEREEANKRIAAIEKERTRIQKALPADLTVSKVQGQLTAGEAAAQALKKEIADRKSQNKGTAIENTQLFWIEQQNKALEKTLSLLQKIYKVNTLAAGESRLKALQENLQREDINSTEFISLNRQIAGQSKANSDAQLLPEEQKMIELQAMQKAITAQMQLQEQVSKVKLGRLENERRLLQSNLELEKTRSQLAETLADRKVQVANAYNDPVSARAAEAEVRGVRSQGQQRELAVQSQLIEKNREQARIEAALQAEQISVQRQQIAIDLQMLAIEKVKFEAALKTKDVQTALIPIYQTAIGYIKATVDAIQKQKNGQGDLGKLIAQNLQSQEQAFDVQQQELGLRGQINSAQEQTAGQLAEIQARQEKIAAAEEWILNRIKLANDQLERMSQSYQDHMESQRAQIEYGRERLRLAEELASAEMQSIDKMLELQNTQDSGGFFERMAKFSEIGNKTEGDAYALAQRRAQLMQQVQERQAQQKNLELQLKQKEIEAERALLALKTAQLRVANEESKARLRTTLISLRDTLANSGNEAGVALANQGIQKLGVNPSGNTGGNPVLVRLENALNEADAITKAGEAISYQESQRSYVLNAQTELLKENISATNELNAANKQLADIDSAQWFAKFRDESTSIGRVLSAAAQSISEFRQSVSAGLVEGLMGGDGASAISDAGKQFANKVLTSIVDEYVMKPMEKNLFAGLSKLLGFEQPKTEQQQIAANTLQQAQIAGETKASIGALDQSLKSIDATIKSGIQQIVGAIGAPGLPGAIPPGAAPAPAQAAAAAQAAVGTAVKGAIGNMLPGTKGGPNINEGVGWSAWRGRNHNGQDLGLDVGDPIHSRMNGKVMDAYSSGFGKVGGAVVVQYENGQRGTYGHVNPNVQAGDSVLAGQKIATVAPDGQNTHLHYELRSAVGELLNPLNAIKQSLQARPGVAGGPPAPALPKATAAPSVAAVPTLGTAAGAPVPVVVTNPDVINPATGLTPGDYGGTPLAVQSFGGKAIEKASTDLAGTVAAQATAISTAFPGLTDSVSKAASSVTAISQNAQPVPQGLQGFGQALGGVVSVLGSIGMGLAGVQQMGKGGTYNTLMGLAGIFGAIGGIAGAFGTGGSLSGLFRASGGPVTARKPYIVGEQGPELMIPEGSGNVLSTSRTANVLASTRAALEQSRRAKAEAGGSAPSAANASPIDIRYESQVINNVEYVTADQFRSGMKSAAERGKSMALYQMQNSVKTRRRLAM